MKSLHIDFPLSIDLIHERVALGYLFNYLCYNAVITVPRIYTCFDDEIPKGYSERYRVTFCSHDRNITYHVTYSFFFSSRTSKVYVFEFDNEDNCICDHGCYFKYKFT